MFFSSIKEINRVLNKGILLMYEILYFEVLHVCFVKRLCDANLVFCSCPLDARMKTCEKTGEYLLIKGLQINKQLCNKIRSENCIIF